ARRPPPVLGPGLRRAVRGPRAHAGRARDARVRLRLRARGPRPLHRPGRRPGAGPRRRHRGPARGV
ncbi:MAG: hypothetical protein AVDCRST_MAG13-3298, partial [uncultured Solirubrobacteraceae bacterium]